MPDISVGAILRGVLQMCTERRQRLGAEAVRLALELFLASHLIHSLLCVSARTRDFSCRSFKPPTQLVDQSICLIEGGVRLLIFLDELIDVFAE